MLTSFSQIQLSLSGQQISEWNIKIALKAAEEGINNTANTKQKMHERKHCTFEGIRYFGVPLL